MSGSHPISIAAALLAALCGACGRQPPPACESADLVLPPGFCASVFADGFKAARHVAAADDGRVFVNLMRPSMADGGGSVVAIADHDNDARAEPIGEFGDIYGADVKWRDPFVYVSSSKQIVRFRLEPGASTAAPEGEVVLDGLPQAFAMEHSARPIAFDDAGRLYVHVGAPSNSCQQENRRVGSAGMYPCPQLADWAGVWRFPADAVGLRFPADGERIVTGLRHVLAMAWNTRTESMHFVQQGRDDLHQMWPDRYSPSQNASAPAEELLSGAPGSNYGWPYCYFDGVQGLRVPAPEFVGYGIDATACARFDQPLLAFPAHTSPTDLLFYSGEAFPERYRGGVFISFAGGWGRMPFHQQGHRVAFVPFANGRLAHTWEVFADGFVAGPISKPGASVARPSGLAELPDGTLLVLDSSSGRLWRIRFVGPS